MSLFWAARNLSAGSAGTSPSTVLYMGEAQLFTPLMESWEIILVEDLLSLAMKCAVFC